QGTGRKGRYGGSQRRIQRGERELFDAQALGGHPGPEPCRAMDQRAHDRAPRSRDERARVRARKCDGERHAATRAVSCGLSKARRDPRRCRSSRQAHHVGSNLEERAERVNIATQFVKYVTVAVLSAASDWAVFATLFAAFG